MSEQQNNIESLSGAGGEESGHLHDGMDGSPQGASLAERLRARQEADLSTGAVAAGTSLAFVDAKAAKKYRNHLIAESPRAAWALSGLVGEHGKQKPEIVALEELRGQERGYRSDSDEESFLERAAREAAQASSSEEKRKNARAATRWALRAIRAGRIEGLASSSAYTKSDKEITVLARVARRILADSAFSEGDALALLRALSGPAQPLDEAPLTRDAQTDAILREDAKRHAEAIIAQRAGTGRAAPQPTEAQKAERERWAGVRRRVARRQPSAEALLGMLKSALIGQKREAAKKIASMLPGSPLSLHQADWGVSLPEDSRTQGLFAWERADDGRLKFFVEDNQGVREERDPMERASAGLFALSMAQGLGWEWLREAGASPTGEDAKWIASRGEPEQIEAFASWIVEQGRAAIELESLHAPKAGEKRSAFVSDLPRDDRWSVPAGFALSGALPPKELEGLAPSFGSSPVLWNLLLRERKKRETNDCWGNSISIWANNMSEATDALERARKKMGGDLAEGIRYAESSKKNDGGGWRATKAADHDADIARLQGWSEALEKSDPVVFESLPADAPTPSFSRSESRSGSDATKLWAQRVDNAKALMDAAVDRAWMAQWIGPRAWEGMPWRPAGLLRDEREWVSRCQEKAETLLLRMAEEIVFDASPGAAERERAFANALAKAWPIDHWRGPSGVAGDGPLRLALGRGKEALAIAMLQSGDNARCNVVSMREARRSDFDGQGQCSAESLLRAGYWPSASSAKIALACDTAGLGVAGFALMCGSMELARAAKKAARKGFERDLEQISLWAKMKEGAPEAFELAIAKGEALALEEVKAKGSRAKKAKAADASGEAAPQKASKALRM
jgi:hypothetical protein